MAARVRDARHPGRAGGLTPTLALTLTLTLTLALTLTLTLTLTLALTLTLTLALALTLTLTRWPRLGERPRRRPPSVHPPSRCLPPATSPHRARRRPPPTRASSRTRAAAWGGYTAAATRPTCSLRASIRARGRCKGTSGGARRAGVWSRGVARATRGQGGGRAEGGTLWTLDSPPAPPFPRTFASESMKLNACICIIYVV